ncbi:fucose 4-O-acetylase-like acetyltransferase [Microbacterium marinum]|uniref:Fucose 4-O-acetylase-like acetyltransferase n=1 Tax=Microbacterium marinum TaxID=421115 RepID=A0A7W7BRZ5_9MICO|nr:acyltransferase family protein [Microbacterium marinum]MBB4667767.1 fucose 4-O-acetylase-like acetyltransferase [Microbacterium marinum]
MSTAAPAAPRTRRVPIWDNARAACILLVVLGHAIQRLTYDSDIALSLYFLIYAFHMPAFALISGYFSKSDPPNRRQMTRVLTDIVLPYVIFEGLWTATKLVFEGEANPNLTQPSWTLWFLLALAIFRVVLPYLALLRWPLLWTVLISLSVGYLPNVDSTLSLSRTLGLLPFFTLGWWLSHHKILEKRDLLRRRRLSFRIGAALLFAVTAFISWRFVNELEAMNLRQWLFYDENYAAIGGTEWWAGGVRLALMLIAVVLSVAFFALIPRGGYRWTAIGRYTMYVYLLHSFVLYPFRESGILRDLDPTWVFLPLVILLSIVITVGLASRPVRRLFRPLIEPRPGWLFADPSLTRRDTRRNDPTGSRRPDTGSRSPQPERRDGGTGAAD